MTFMAIVSPYAETFDRVILRSPENVFSGAWFTAEKKSAAVQSEREMNSAIHMMFCLR
jgi:hypothetical protein